MNHEIILSNRDLNQVPEWIYSNVNTITLKLDFNHITSISDSLLNLSNLRYLNLRGNEIKVFPNVLTLLSNLQILDLSRNKLRQLPEDFGNLVNLRVLSIYRNKIQNLPLYIADLAYLQVLKIDNNPIINVPENILHYDKAYSMEEWIATLKLYLKSSFSNNSNRNHPNTRNSQFQSCDTIAQTAFELSNHDGIKALACSISLSLSMVHRHLKTISSRIKTSRFPQLEFDNNLNNLNSAIINLVNRIETEPKIEKLKQSVVFSLSECKKSIEFIIQYSNVLVDSIDHSLIRSFLACWYSTIFEFDKMISGSTLKTQPATLELKENNNLSSVCLDCVKLADIVVHSLSDYINFALISGGDQSVIIDLADQLEILKESCNSLSSCLNVNNHDVLIIEADKFVDSSLRVGTYVLGYLKDSRRDIDKNIVRIFLSIVGLNKYLKELSTLMTLNYFSQVLRQSSF